MIRNINKDITFLQIPSKPANKGDKSIIVDLTDTLSFHRDRCVGMAANMIGFSKRIIIVNIGVVDMIMVNPKITFKEKPYITEEGCLSLMGQRKTTRYEVIKVDYLDRQFKPQSRMFSGFTAQIIQHEIDHCDGIII